MTSYAVSNACTQSRESVWRRHRLGSLAGRKRQGAGGPRHFLLRWRSGSRQLPCCVATGSSLVPSSSGSCASCVRGSSPTSGGRIVAFLRRGAVAAITLPFSKTAQRSGEPEVVLLHDAPVVALLRELQGNLKDGRPFFPGGWVALARGIQSCAGAFGMATGSLTPYCLRRGGATWHFERFGSYDATTELGRWQDRRTARVYINQAMADVAALSLPRWGQSRLERAAHALPALLREACLSREGALL